MDHIQRDFPIYMSTSYIYSAQLVTWHPAENSDPKSPTFPSKGGNVEWMMVIISCLSNEPRKKNTKTSKNKKTQKTSIYL